MRPAGCGSRPRARRAQRGLGWTHQSASASLATYARDSARPLRAAACAGRRLVEGGARAANVLAGSLRVTAGIALATLHPPPAHRAAPCVVFDAFADGFAAGHSSSPQAANAFGHVTKCDRHRGWFFLRRVTAHTIGRPQCLHVDDPLMACDSKAVQTIHSETSQRSRCLSFAPLLSRRSPKRFQSVVRVHRFHVIVIVRRQWRPRTLALAVVIGYVIHHRLPRGC